MEQEPNKIEEAVKNKAKSTAKIFLKRGLRVMLPYIIGFIVVLFVVIIVAGGLDIIFKAIGDKLKEIGQSIVEFFTIDDDGGINMTDDKIDDFIKQLESDGISLSDLWLTGDVDSEENGEDTQEPSTDENEDSGETSLEKAQKKAKRKYIKKFLEAEAVTQMLNYGKFEMPGKTYGRVYVNRMVEQENGEIIKEQLEFEKYENFMKMQEDNNSNIKKYFTINESGQLVIGSTTTTIVRENGVVDNEQGGTEVTTRNIDYKSELAKYSTPAEFLVYLTMTTQNPEFVSKVADLIKDSRIEITVMDNVTANKITETYTYTEVTETKEEVEYTREDDFTDEKLTYERVETDTDEEQVTETTERTVISSNPSIAITYAKTWFSEQTIEYTRTTEDPVITPIPVEEIEPEEIPEHSDELPSTITYKKDQNKEASQETQVTKFGETTRGEVIDKTGEKGDGEKSFIGLLDVPFKIPNSQRLVAAGSNLYPGGGDGYLFELLQRSSNMQTLEQLMRYIMYKYTGNDKYGVKDFDFSIFGIGEFQSVAGIYGGTVQEKVWFTLIAAGYSEYAVAGVMGNIEGESSFNPTIIEAGSGIGAGLCQWSYGRREQLEKYMQSKGVDLSDVDTQIEFLLTEITPGAVGPAQGYANYQMLKYNGYTPDMWENAQSPSEAAIAFCWSFERPGVPRLDVRIAAAEKYYNLFHGRQPGGSSASDGDGYTQVYTSSKGRTYKEYKQYLGSYSSMLYQPYGKPISSDGCSITGIAVILSGYGINVNPGDLARHNYLQSHFLEHGVSCTAYQPASKERMMSGRPMLVSIAGTLKAGGASIHYDGHYIAILDARGTDEVYVSDVGSGSVGGWAKVDDIIRIVNRGILYVEQD